MDKPRAGELINVLKEAGQEVSEPLPFTVDVMLSYLMSSFFKELLNLRGRCLFVISH
jgi:hypothetical protein